MVDDIEPLPSSDEDDAPDVRNDPVIEPREHGAPAHAQVHKPEE